MSIWLNRQGYYSIIAKGLVISTVFSVTISALLGFHKGTIINLLFGSISGQIISAIYLLNFMKSRINFKLQRFDINVVFKLLKSHRDLMVFHLPSDMLNKLTNQAPVFILSNQFGPTIVGYYSLSARMLGLPILLLGNPMSQIFYQKAMEAVNQGLDYSKTFNKVFFQLLLAAVSFYICINLFGEKLFVLAFE